MSRKLRDKARRRLEKESGPPSRPWGGRRSVALVYPGTYRQAMSNLGFLSVHRMLNARDETLCERFFLPDPPDLVEHRRSRTPLFSLESQRLLTDFDLVAFSISFENDYLNLPALFELARLPLDREERRGYPLLLAGGVCAFLNPEPLAGIMDLFAVGEAEVLVPPLLAALTRGEALAREDLLAEISALPGFYVPSRYRVTYREDGTPAGFDPEPGAPVPVVRQWLPDLDAAPTTAALLTPDTEFGDMVTTEVSRGCSRGCRFCAAGFLYLPPRERSLDLLAGEVAEGLCRRRRIGLVGTAVSDHPRLEELVGEIRAQGGEAALSSLRLDTLTEGLAFALRESGLRTVAVAPEAGSARLRQVINKDLEESQMTRAVGILARAGIPNLKLYFLVGLPTETDEDLAELVALVERLRDLWLAEGKRLGRLGSVTVSTNPFVPKPFTPFQWAAMDSEKELKRKIRLVRGALKRLPNTEVQFESLRSARIQGLLSRGDRRTGAVIPELAAGASLEEACRRTGLDPEFYLTRERERDELFPWEVLHSGVRREVLWEEWCRARQARPTPRCAPGCRRCGVCL